MGRYRNWREASRQHLRDSQPRPVRLAAIQIHREADPGEPSGPQIANALG